MLYTMEKLHKYKNGFTISVNQKSYSCATLSVVFGVSNDWNSLQTMQKKFELIINQIFTHYYGLDLFFSLLKGYFNKDGHWFSTQYCQEIYQWMRSLRVMWSGSRGFTMSKISSFTSWKETGSCPWIFICSCIAYNQERQLRISIWKLSNPACQPYFI